MDACGFVIIAKLPPEAGIIIWGSVIIIVLLAAGGAFALAKKHWAAEARRGWRIDSGFSIERLEEMHESGQISDEEFERLRRQVIDAAQAGATPGRASSHPPRSDDGNAGKTH